MLSRHASGAAMQHEERTVSAASTVPMPSRSSSATMHEEHATSDASTLRKLPFSAASATAQQKMHASTDPDGAHAMLVLKYYNVLLSTPHSSPTASSSHDASPHQHPAVHHDLTSPCTPIASAAGLVRTPYNAMTPCDPAPPQGARINLEATLKATQRQIFSQSPTSATCGR